tara:strand:- start:54 stop:521 length:468 start_codon:yes stop_codon:yes gene_type:complete
MKLAAKQLKQIILEELTHLLQEGELTDWASQAGLGDEAMGQVLTMPGGIEMMVTMMKHGFEPISHGAMGMGWKKEMTTPNYSGMPFKESHKLTFTFSEGEDDSVIDYSIESNDPNDSVFYREFDDLYGAKEFIEKRMEGGDADGAPNPMFRGLGI